MRPRCRAARSCELPKIVDSVNRHSRIKAKAGFLAVLKAANLVRPALRTLSRPQRRQPPQATDGPHGERGLIPEDRAGGGGVVLGSLAHGSALYWCLVLMVALFAAAVSVYRALVEEKRRLYFGEMRKKCAVY